MTQMRMNPELRKALRVLTDFYIDTVSDEFGVFQTPGHTTSDVDDAWLFVVEAVGDRLGGGWSEYLLQALARREEKTDA